MHKEQVFGITDNYNTLLFILLLCKKVLWLACKHITDEICKIYGLSPLGYNCWIDLMNESYQYYKYLALNANPINSECKAAIYFWPLKDSLYRIASTLYNRQ